MKITEKDWDRFKLFTGCPNKWIDYDELTGEYFFINTWDDLLKYTKEQEDVVKIFKEFVFILKTEKLLNENN